MHAIKPDSKLNYFQVDIQYRLANLRHREKHTHTVKSVTFVLYGEGMFVNEA